jgi:hypothetical protein
VENAILHFWLRPVVRAHDLFQLAKLFLVIGGNDLAENFGELLDELHRFADQDWIPHDNGRKARPAPEKTRVNLSPSAAMPAMI